MAFLLQKYPELVTKNAITVKKEAALAGEFEQTYTLTLKTFDVYTGDQRPNQEVQVTREGLIRSKTGLQAQIDGINALITDIDKL
jgi:hypothetical protein